MKINDVLKEEKVRLDPKCWKGKKIGNPKTKVKGGVRVNNCVPAESVAETKADPTSTWVVYDGDRVKRFKTHQGAKAYAEQHGGKVASSAHYADKIQGKQGVAESKLYVKRLTSEKSLVEHAKLFSKNLKSDNVPRTALNHYSVVCSTIFARNKKSITESKHITDGNQVIQLIKRLDQFSQLPIKVGAKVAIINSQFQGDSIELWGFTTPNTISKIYKDPSDGSIKQFEFNNDPDDVWPRTENAEYNGQFLMYSAFFGDKKSAEHALTMITLQGSGDLNIRNHITEQGVAEGDYNIRRDPTYQKYNPETHVMMYKDGKHKLVKHDQVANARSQGWKVRSSLKAFAKGQGSVAEAANPAQQAAIAIAMKKKGQKPQNEEFSGEYDDEAGMFKNDLQTIQRVSRHLEKEILDNENLPEWCQAKIAQAKGMIVNVMDYMISQHENGEIKELAEEFDMIERIVEGIAAHNGVDAEVVWADLESLTEDELYAFAVTSQLNEDWQKVNKKDKTDGMSQKAVNAYRREHPGSKLKTAVTTKPSKLKKGSKASKRRKSYCSRSRGQMKMHNISCAKTPDKAICKARRRWNC